MRLIRLRSTCPDTATCPTLHRPEHDPDVVYVQGWVITDPEILTALDMPPGESAVRVPTSLLLGLSSKEVAG